MFRPWVLVPLLFAVGISAYGLAVLGALIREADEAVPRPAVDFESIQEDFPLEQTCGYFDKTTGSTVCTSIVFWADGAPQTP